MVLPRVVVEPAMEPVIVSEAKEHLRLEVADDDAAVGRMISAARRHLEKVCWRGIVTQTKELTLPGFYDESLDVPTWAMKFFRQERPLPLPGGHLTDPADLDVPSPVEFVKYLDADGALTTLDASAYEVERKDGEVGVLRPVFGTSWPTPRDTWNAVTVRYRVGWKQDKVPEDLVQALLLLVSQMYEHRTPEVTGTIIAKVGFAVTSLSAPYRLVRL